MAKGLSEKQRRFVEAYMGQAAGNALEAARIAGYSSPRGSSNANMKNSAILDAIGKRQESDPLIADRKERQRFWTAMMRGELTRDDVTLEGKLVKVGPSWNERMRASELLGRSCADFVDRKEHSGPGGGPIRTARDLTDDELAAIAFGGSAAVASEEEGA